MSLYEVPLTSVGAQMTNYNALREEGQGFYLREASVLFATPGSNTSVGIGLHWWCDFEFASEENDNYGYAGRAVEYFLGSILEDIVAQGAPTSPSSNNNHALSLSAVWVPTLGLFEGQIHDTQDPWVGRYWDNGSLTLPFFGWKGQEEGVETGGFSGTTTYTKITTDAAANYLGRDVEDMTPATCSREYEAAWNITPVPDPFDTSMTKLEEKLLLRVVTIEESLVAAEEDVAQLQADNKELQANNKKLLLRVALIEESLAAAAAAAKNTGSGKSIKKQKKQIRK